MRTVIRVLMAGLLGLVLVAAALAQSTEIKIPITTTSDEARQLFVEARTLAENFKPVDARALYQQAIAKDPNFALAYWGLAQVQPNAKLFREDMDKAASLVDNVSECERDLILSSKAAGDVDLQKQRQYLGRLVDRCGQDERARMNMAVYYFGRQYYDSAAAELHTATVLASGYSPAWNMLGYACRNSGDMGGAEHAFQKYVELDPQNANAHDSYAELLLKQGRYDEAVQRYRQALAVDPDFAISRFNMAAPLVYANKHDDARRELDTMLAGARDDGQRQTAYFGLAMVELDQGNYDAAVAQIRKSDAIDATNGDVAQQAQNAVTIGLIRVEQGQYDEARAQFQKAVDLTRHSDLAPTVKALAERADLYGRARIASLQGDVAQARQLADAFAGRAQATGSIDDLRSSHELYGVIALDAKQYDIALSELQQANQQDAHNLYRLAMAYDGLDNHPAAVKAMQAAAGYNGLLNLNNVIMHQKSVALATRWNSH